MTMHYTPPRVLGLWHSNRLRFVVCALAGIIAPIVLTFSCDSLFHYGVEDEPSSLSQLP